MTYVKLIAKPGTWFKAGTEAYDYDCTPPHDLRRITLEAWEEWCQCPIVLARGIRVIENPASEGGGQVGEEHWDGESCRLDEFEVKLTEDPC